jgi:hypothetical protein
MVVTEKIDGTNAAVIVAESDKDGRFPLNGAPGACAVGADVFVLAQSRKRLIAPGMDNHGFAAWVWDNAGDLAHALGPGVHFGEWWGGGIGRGYGLAKDDKRFSLFNTKRWADTDFDAAGLNTVSVVPVLDLHTFDTGTVQECLARLRMLGSYAAPGFMSPEGVVVYHTQGNVLFKATLENDERGKEFGG